MGKQIQVSLVCCEPNDAKQSQVVPIQVDESILTERLISTAQQQVPANEAKDLHLAAAHPEHGKVTYLQEVTEGGFFVYVGDPTNLVEHWFGAGTFVAFNDDTGPGHASKVGPDGCTRTFRMLRNHLDITAE